MSEIKVWNWNNFRGGIADNQYIGQEGCYQTGSYNVDTESEPGGVKLAANIKDYLTLTGRPNAMYYGTNLITMCEDLSVAKNNAIQFAYNSAPAIAMGKLYAAEEMYVSGTKYLFLFSSGAIHKAAVDLSSVSYTVATPQSGTNIKTINYSGDGFIYFTVGNVLYRYTSSEVLTALFTASADIVIEGITQFQDTIKLYGRDTSQTKGVQYIFDISDFSTTPTVPSYVVAWNGLPIYGATNVGSSDYVLAGPSQNYLDLYEVSGTQRIQIKGNTDGIKFRTFNGGIISRRDDCYIVGGITSGSTNCLYKYGTYYPGIPDTLTCPFCDSTYQYKTLASSGLYIYAGMQYNTTYKIKQIELSTPPFSTSYYIGTGEIMSMIFDGGNRFAKKSLKEVVISYDCDNSHVIPKGGSFELYARTKNSGTWTKIGDTYTKTDVGFVRITENIISAAGFSTFTQIELKLKLLPATNSGNNYYTPFISGVQLQYYDDISTND